MILLLRITDDDMSGADHSASSRKRKPGQEAALFKTDNSGKLVIPDSDSEAEQPNAGGGNAFMAAQRGVDGASRDARGNLRFNKNTKRARAEEERMGMDLDEVMGEKKKDKDAKDGKKRSKVVGRLGEEFRAKVSNVKYPSGASRADALVESWRGYQEGWWAGSLCLCPDWPGCAEDG